MRRLNHRLPSVLMLPIAAALIGISPAMGETALSVTAKPATLISGSVQVNTGLADEYLLRGKYDQSEALYRVALIANPNDTGAVAGLAMALAKQFKLDPAQEAVDAALTADPLNQTAHAAKSLVLLNRLQSSSGSVIARRADILAQAESEALYAVNLAPGDALARTQLACVYREQERFQEAEAQFRMAIEIDPQLSDAYCGLGYSSLAQGNSTVAGENFREAINLNSGNWSARCGLAEVYVAEGMADEAIAQLNIAIHQYPNSHPAHLTLGKAYFLQGNTNAALKELQLAATIKPEIVEPYMHMADIYEGRGDLDHALLNLSSALAVVPDNIPIRLRYADTAVRAGQMKNAVEAYKLVRKSDADNRQATLGLARAYFQLAQAQTGAALLGTNEFADSIRTLTEAIKISPDDLELRSALARIERLSGQSAATVAVSTPHSDGERVAYARALMAKYRFAESSEQFSKLISSAPDGKQTLAVADLALLFRDLDAAEAAYKKALVFPDTESRARRGLNAVDGARRDAVEDARIGSELLRNKQWAGALERFRQAVATNPKLPEAQWGLARALEKSPNVTHLQLAEAANHYRAYLTLNPALSRRQQEKTLSRIARMDRSAARLAARTEAIY